MRRWAVVVVVLALAGGASAHRLDELLQASMVTLERDRVHVSLRLVPGVAVAGEVLAALDSDGDGVVSVDEERAYGEGVLAEQTLSVDGRPLAPALVSTSVSDLEDLREGLGEIVIDWTANVPPGSLAGGRRRLVVENHHASAQAAYLVNCLAPADPGIQIVAQRRNDSQSVYEVT